MAAWGRWQPRPVNRYACKLRRGKGDRRPQGADPNLAADAGCSGDQVQVCSQGYQGSDVNTPNCTDG
jgi:hypothetical protein